jgi:hypothetical protein
VRQLALSRSRLAMFSKFILVVPEPGRLYGEDSRKTFGVLGVDDTDFLLLTAMLKAGRG